MPRVLIFLAEGFEEMETIAPVDLLRRAGLEVILAAIGAERRVRGRNGVTLEADELFANVVDKPFDLLVVPGGPGHAALRADEAVLNRLRRQKAEDGWLAAICAGPLVLHEAGLLEGKRSTGHPTITEELPERIADEAVVQDGRLITSQGAGTATAFGLALVEALCGKEKAGAVARAICYLAEKPAEGEPGKTGGR